MAKIKRIWLFREGNATMRDELGGKGANLAEMTKIGLPVPAGFTITTMTCNEYTDLGGQLPSGFMNEVKTALADVEKSMGKKLGDTTDPLLVSVRSWYFVYGYSLVASAFLGVTFFLLLFSAKRQHTVR